MSNPAKPANSRSAKPLMALVPSVAPGTPTEAKPNSGSKPDSPRGRSPVSMTVETRRAMIAEAAYYIAERRGFGSGRDVEDWLRAEEQIDSALSA
jgi:DUF2934 family protein